MSKSRKLILLLLLLPWIAAAGFLASLNAEARRGFLADYASTLGRLVQGEWELAELRDPVRTEASRRRDDFGRWGGYATSARDVFAKLDRDGDDRLTTEELGYHLTLRSGRTDAIDVDAFQQLMLHDWIPAVPGKTSAAMDWAEATLATVEPRTVESSESVPKASVLASASDAQADATAVPDPSRDAEFTAFTRLHAEQLLDPSQVMVVNVEIAEDDWRTLCRQSRSHQTARENPLVKPYTEFPAAVTLNGVTIDKVTVRKKGFIGSQDTVRPSLKVSFEPSAEQSPVEGLDRITLNNNKQDRALVSQMLTYFLFRKAGIHAPRAAYAAVSVNGRYLGVYTHVESVKKPFLQRIYGSDEGPVFEGTLTDIYPKSIEWFEPKTKQSEDGRSLLLQLAERVYNESTTLEDLSAMVDIDGFLTYWAIESLINFWDGYSQNQNNYFISQNPHNGLLYFLPWGADSCFGGRPHFVQRNGEYSESIRATGILANRLYHFDGIPARYKQAMLDVLENVWDEEELLAEIDRIEFLLRDHMDIHQLSAIVASDSIRDFIKHRRESIVDELTNRWPASVADQPRIPQYRETVGQAQGTFARTDSGAFTLDATFTLDGQSIRLTQMQIEDDRIHLATEDEAWEEAELELQYFERAADDGRHVLRGEVAVPFRQQHEIEGWVTLISEPSATEPRSIKRGEFEFTVRERRGGRW